MSFSASRPPTGCAQQLTGTTAANASCQANDVETGALLPRVSSSASSRCCASRAVAEPFLLPFRCVAALHHAVDPLVTSEDDRDDVSTPRAYIPTRPMRKQPAAGDFACSYSCLTMISATLIGVLLAAVLCQHYLAADFALLARARTSNCLVRNQTLVHDLERGHTTPYSFQPRFIVSLDAYSARVNATALYRLIERDSWLNYEDAQACIDRAPVGADVRCFYVYDDDGALRVSLDHDQRALTLAVLVFVACGLGAALVWFVVSVYCARTLIVCQSP